jgi:hypothetical protein
LCSSAARRENGWCPFGYLQFKTQPRRRRLADRAYGSCRRARLPWRSSGSTADRANRQLHAPRRQSLPCLSARAGWRLARQQCGSTPLARCCRSRTPASWRYPSSNVCARRLCQPLARSVRLRPALWCADEATDGSNLVLSRSALRALWRWRRRKHLAQMQKGDARRPPPGQAQNTRMGTGALRRPWATRLISRRGLPSSQLSACSACIAFLYPRKNSCFAMLWTNDCGSILGRQARIGFA